MKVATMESIVKRCEILSRTRIRLSRPNHSYPATLNEVLQRSKSHQHNAFAMPSSKAPVIGWSSLALSEESMAEFHFPPSRSCRTPPSVAQGLTPEPGTGVTLTTFVILSGLLLYFEMASYGKWLFNQTNGLSRANPSYQLAVVGNFVVASLGTRVRTPRGVNGTPWLSYRIMDSTCWLCLHVPVVPFPMIGMLVLQKRFELRHARRRSFYGVWCIRQVAMKCVLRVRY